MDLQPEEYWLVLELDPATEDEAVIQAHIQRKASEWSQTDSAGGQMPAAKRQAQAYLQEVPRMKAVLLDEAQRRQLVPAARARIREERERRAQALQRDLSDLSAKGHLEAKEVERLVLRHACFALPEAEVRAAIKTPVRKPEAAPDAPRLDPTILAGIRGNLQHLRKRSLYDFLGISPRSGRGALLARVREVAVRPENRAARKDARLNATLALVSAALDVFSDDAKRRAYDHELSLEGLDEVTRLFDLVGSDVLDAAVYRRLLARGREAGLPEDAVRRHVLDLARRRGVAVVAAADAQEQQCGHCWQLSPAGAAACAGCGQPLSLPCPGCSARVHSTHRRCTSCGFPVGNLPEIERRLREAKAALHAGRLEEALRILASIGDDLLEGHPIPEEARRLEEAARAERAKREGEIDEIRDLMARARLHEAQRRLAGLQGAAATGAEARALADACAHGLKSAAKAIEHARAAERAGDKESAFAHVARALALAADDPAARALVHRYPPQPPMKVAAKQTEKGILLSWSRSPSGGNLTYEVRRAQGRPPEAPGEGDALGQTPEERWLDDSAQTGAAYHYAVFAVREGVASTLERVGPVLVLAEVEGVAALPGDGEAVLSWRAPLAARAVRILRREGVSWVEVTTQAGRGAFTDRPLRNGTERHYLLQALFDVPGAAPVPSRGVEVRVTPREPPVPPARLDARIEGGRVHLAWKPLPDVAVALVRCVDPPPFRRGERRALAEIRALGRELTPQCPGYAQDEVGPQPVAHYLSFVPMGPDGVVGAATSVTNLPEVADLQANAGPDVLQLRWTWPGHAPLCRVAMRLGSPPEGPEDPKAMPPRDVDADTYQRTGFVTPLPRGAEDVHLAVYPFLVREGGRSYGSAAGPGARAHVRLGRRARRDCAITYSVSRRSGWVDKLVGAGGATYVVELTSDEEVVLPQVVLVARTGGPPLDVDGGVRVGYLPVGRRVGPRSPLEWKVEGPSLPRGSYARVFFTDPAQALGLRLAPRSALMDIGR